MSTRDSLKSVPVDGMAEEPCENCSELYGHLIFHDPRFGEYCNYEQDKLVLGQNRRE